jgi:uncharacterized membrane protein
MSDKKIILVFLLILFLPAFVRAEGFEVFKGSTIEPLCPGSTGVFTDFVENQDISNLEFTISKSGSGSAFTTVVPQGFVLKPGETRAIYSYVTPKTMTSIGMYGLDVVVSANGQTETLSHNIEVEDCYDFKIQALDKEKNVCPCEIEKFDFVIENLGFYLGDYLLEVEGESADSVTLSEEILSIPVDGSKTIFAYFTAGCDDVGSKEFTVVAKSEGGVIKSDIARMIIDPCYDFNVKTQKDFISMCDHSVESIAIQIENDGSTSNIYNLDVDGPAWANLDNNKLEISSGSSGTANLVLSPDYDVQGDFEIDFKAVTEKGELEAENTFNVKVRKCYGVSIQVEKESDKICNSLENDYGVVIKNIGEFSKEYVIELLAPDWVNIDKNSVVLDDGESETLTLNVAPKSDTVPSTYEIKIKARAVDSDKVFTEAVLDIIAVSREECYRPSISIEEKDAVVYFDTTATIPVVVENKGAYSATYDVAVTGTASNFVYLNPGTVTVEPDKAELLYLYIAPTTQILAGDYKTTVSVRLGDGTILASESVDIKVLEGEKPVEEEVVGEVPEEEAEEMGAWERFKRFLRRIFGVKDVNVTEEEEPEIPEMEEEAEEEELEFPEEQEEKEVIDFTEENVQSKVSGLGEEAKLILGEVEHKVTVEEI